MRAEAKASSGRGIAKVYRCDRAFVYEGVRSGELRAARLGKRRLLILHSDFEDFLRRRAVQPDIDPHRVATERLRHEKAAS